MNILQHASGYMVDLDQLFAGGQPQRGICKIHLQLIYMLSKIRIRKFLPAVGADDCPVIDDRHTVTVAQKYRIIMGDDDNCYLFPL